jgi:hypothetical protein
MKNQIYKAVPIPGDSSKPLTKQSIEELKSIYDKLGHKKETTTVNSAVKLSGQEIPTVDIALFSRVVFTTGAPRGFITRA